MERTRIVEISKFVTSIIVCQLAGTIGLVFTTPSTPTWYATIWITLFALMGVSAFLVWRKGMSDQRVRTGLSIFAIQLILSTLWSVIFFGLTSPLAGLIVISVLWTAILLTILNFLKISTTAGLLLVPYILWVSFAAVVNFFVWRPIT